MGLGSSSKSTWGPAGSLLGRGWSTYGWLMKEIVLGGGCSVGGVIEFGENDYFNNTFIGLLVAGRSYT